MKVLFLGGDKRQLEIINGLYQKGNEIHLVGFDNIDIQSSIIKKNTNNLKMIEYNVIILPVSGVKKDLSVESEFNDCKVTLPSDLLVNTRKDVIIFTGIMTDVLGNMLKMADRHAVVLMDDNDIKKENSIPTVEGIIGDLVYNTEYTINGSNILILGYGNVGKLLVSKLQYLGANVTVGVITEEDFNSLKEHNINGFYTNNADLMKSIIKNNDIIINTVPNILLSKEYLEVVGRKSYILDVASHPHGVDFDKANEMNIKNKLLLGIPSLVAPKTAGLILTKKINSILGGEKNG
jgi:dipicolinate synthase subunit A